MNTPETQALNDFREHPDQILKRLRDDKRPLTLTVNGEPAAVIQDPQAYPQFLDIAATADPMEGIRQGLAEAEAGQGEDVETSSRTSRPAVAYRIEIMPRSTAETPGSGSNRMKRSRPGSILNCKKIRTATTSK